MPGHINEYNTSDVVRGGVNILEAFDTEESVRFNESYLITGEMLKARDIFAMYNLTVIGDVTAASISANGTLCVDGNIKADTIQCTSGITCTGKIQCQSINCEADVITMALDAKKIDIYGNLMVSFSVNVAEECKVERNILVGEGLSGSGQLKAENVMTVDYFDFDGEAIARIFEMETMFQQNSDNNMKNEVEETNENNKDDTEVKYEDLLEDFLERSSRVISTLEEDEIIEILGKCAVIQKVSFGELAFLFNEVVRISYQDAIEGIKDYLLVSYAQKVFPQELKSYETIEHVFSKFLEEVEPDELEYTANTKYEFMMSLKILDICFDNDEEISDKVFSFIGIRYNTVKKQFEGDY